MSDFEKIYIDKFKKIVEEFNSSPFLFIGSGFSKRYLNTPDWKNLLIYFSDKIDKEGFLFRRLASLYNNDFTRVAQYLNKNYDNLWYTNKDFRDNECEEIFELEKRGVNPFHAAVACYISSFNIVQDESKLKELELFKILTRKSLSGIITTNYDLLLKKLTVDYKVFVGQNELLLSSPAGIGEIYQIHGSVVKPNSIIINSEDYKNFNEKSQYLSAKLLTLFIENPIIFIGYGLNDPDIRCIFDSIITCFKDDIDDLNEFSKQIFFVNYKVNSLFELSEYEYNQILKFTKITIDDFSVLYDILSSHKQKIPVGIMRKFKNEFYSFVKTRTPTESIIVADIEDSNIDDTDYALYFGLKEVVNKFTNCLMFLRDDVFEDIILNSLEGSSDEILDNLATRLSVYYVKLTPFCKYIASAKKTIPSIFQIPDFDSDLKSGSNKNDLYSDVNKIFKSEKTLYLKLQYISRLDQSEIVVEDLERELNIIFKNYPHPLTKKHLDFDQNCKTCLRKVIRIYDLLKYGEAANANYKLLTD